MNSWRYPTAFQCWGPEERDAIQRVLSSERFTMGAEVEAFETELAAFHGVKHAIAVNSGSSANLVAVAALFNIQEHPLRFGDRAMVPALAWPTLYAPLVQHGLKLVLVDCDATWNMSTNPLYPVSDCALVVGCSILGNPMDLNWFAETAECNGAIFIEDNCESFGARLHRKLCGTFGRMGTLSFYWSHQLSAIEGGAIVTNDDECAELCRMIRNHGWSRGTKRQPEGFAGEYDFQVMGYNVRPLELHCAIAREQLKKANRFGLERNRNYCRFLDATVNLPISAPDIVPHATINPFGIAFTVQDGATREAVARSLRAQGVDCRPPVGGSFARHPYGTSWRGQSTPNADIVHETGLFIGNAPFDIGDEIARAVDIMEHVL